MSELCMFLRSTGLKLNTAHKHIYLSCECECCQYRALLVMELHYLQLLRSERLIYLCRSGVDFWLTV